MIEIICRKSKKSDNKYLVLVVNGVYVSFDRVVIEKVAMTIGVSNIELNDLEVDTAIKI